MDSYISEATGASPVEVVTIVILIAEGLVELLYLRLKVHLMYLRRTELPVRPLESVD